MAYLTAYNYSKLCRTIKLDQDISLEMFMSKIMDNKTLFYMLSKVELKYLFKFSNILSNEEEFIAEYFNQVQMREDTKKYVFERSSKIKYHIYSDCDLISNKFTGHVIPEEIRDLGDKAIEEFRNWFKKNDYAEKAKSGKLDEKAMIFNYNMTFASKYEEIKPIPEDSTLLKIEERANSGTAVSYDFNYDSFIQELDELCLYYHDRFASPSLRKLSKFKYLLNKSDQEVLNTTAEVLGEEFVLNYGFENIKKKLKEAKKIIGRIMELLIEYFKWNFDLNDHNFKDITLEAFGLEPCRKCVEKSHQINHQN